MSKLKQITCDQTCGFMIISSSRKELSTLFIRHSMVNHDTALTILEVNKKIRPNTAVRKLNLIEGKKDICYAARALL